MTAPSPPENQPRWRVLVVDDVPANLDVIANLLDDGSLDLSFATSGAQALKSVSLSPPDLILLDVAMPDMDGFEVARRLRQRSTRAEVPVIFITARARAEDIVDGFRAGGVDYITKPFSAEELKARVRTHLELKGARDTIARQNDDLRKLVGTKDRFLSILAHDLKNPLHGIINLSDVRLDGGKGTRGVAGRDLALIHSAAEQMAKTLQDLLDWAKLQTGAFQCRPKGFDLSALIGEACLLLDAEATAKEITLARVAPEKEMVVADPIMILTVIRNLLQNAVKYSRRGGSVAVSAEGSARGFVRVSVADHGVGVDQAVLASLSESASRLALPGTEGELGTGLGLKFCREFLALHNSRLEVDTAESKGTTFWFLLARSR